MLPFSCPGCPYFAPYNNWISSFEKIKNTIETFTENKRKNLKSLLPMFLIFSKELIQLLYGAKYAESGSVLRVLSFAVAFLFITNFIHIFLISLKMQKEFVLCNLVPFIFVSVSMLFSVPAYGFMGAAFSGISAYFVSFALSCYITHSRGIFKIPAAAAIKVFIAAIFVIIGSQAIEGMWLGVRLAAAIAAYVLLIMALGVINKEDRAFVRDTAQRLNIMKYLRVFKMGPR
ncbi:MAG: polysaccharide biosynthesis C-terminal domain-containing protein [Nitrospirota bacterium]